eukprot:462062-Prymnesium_polylepis.1
MSPPCDLPLPTPLGPTADQLWCFRDAQAASGSSSPPCSLPTTPTEQDVSPFSPAQSSEHGRTAVFADAYFTTAQLPDLEPDTLLLIASGLANDPLCPCHLVALAGSCKALRAALAAKVVHLEQNYQRAVRLLARGGITSADELASVTVLDLSSCELCDDDMAVLAVLIASGSLAQLEELYLDNNLIGDAVSCSRLGGDARTRASLRAHSSLASSLRAAHRHVGTRYRHVTHRNVTRSLPHAAPARAGPGRARRRAHRRAHGAVAHGARPVRQPARRGGRARPWRSDRGGCAGRAGEAVPVWQPARRRRDGGVGCGAGGG